MSAGERRVKVAIVNYGVGNLRSIYRALEIAGASPVITREIVALERADAIVLPGVGAYVAAMRFINSIRDKFINILLEKPVLGICLGMQLLFEGSEEGGFVRGLGLLKGYVTRLPANVKLPHMGWNHVRIIKEHSHLISGLPKKTFMYFAHSYAPPINDSYTVAITEYGRPFPSIIESGNLFGTQFHPEKSGRHGRILLANFVRLVREEHAKNTL